MLFHVTIEHCCRSFGNAIWSTWPVLCSLRWRRASLEQMRSSDSAYSVLCPRQTALLTVVGAFLAIQPLGLVFAVTVPSSLAVRAFDTWEGVQRIGNLLVPDMYLWPEITANGEARVSETRAAKRGEGSPMSVSAR